MFWLNGPKLNYFKFCKVRPANCFLLNIKSPTVVPGFSPQLFIALKLTESYSVQGDVSELFIFPIFSQYSALGSEITAMKLTNTVMFVLGTETARPME